MSLPLPFVLILTPLLTYLLGSISFSYLIGKAHQHDMRRSGSGNLGAMNAARVLGPVAGLVVLVLDMGKGFLAVWLAQVLTQNQTAVFLACVAVMLGHNFSLFLKFTGGKGIAVAGGFLLLLSPVTFLTELVIGGMVFLITRNIHRAAIAMIFAIAPVLGFLSHSWKFLAMGLILAILSSLRHKKEFKEIFSLLAKRKPANSNVQT